MTKMKLLRKISLFSIVLFLSSCQGGTAETTKYTVNFHTDGGSAVADQIIEEGKLVNKPQDPVKENYVFENWYKEKTFANVYDFATPVHSNFSLYAKYKAVTKSYTVSFDTDGGSVISDQIIEEGKLVSKPQDPVKENYVFENWYKEKTFANIYDFATPVNSNFTLYAKYKAVTKSYTVSFDTDGGSVISEQIIEEGKLVSKPQDPVKENYVFENWYKEKTFVNIYDFATPVNSNFTLYAKYKPATNYYTVTFDSNGGSSILPQEILEGDKVDIPNIPTKNNSIFIGWYLNDAEYDFDSIVTSDITLVAHWKEKNNYIVSTDPATGTAYDVRNDKIKDFIDNFDKEYSAKYKSHGDQYKNKPLTLKWTTSEVFDSFIVDIGDDISFAKYDSYACFENHISIENVFTDKTYYWQVSCVKDGIISSSGEIYEVYVEKSPRLINVDSITNTRDIGGIYIGSKRIKEGLVYRSARLDDISSKGKNTFVTDLGVKTEIELRDETYTVSPIGAELIAIKFPWWTGSTANGIDNPAYWPAVKKAIESFANVNNYPIDFHCSIGQDRTGTLAILIEGLCGASLRDIYIDYELTSFSSVTDGDDPVNQSIHNKYLYQVDPLITYLKSFGKTNDSFQTCVINFLTNKDVIGVSMDTISAIQNILLEDR